MPFLKIETNIEMTSEQARSAAQKASGKAAELLGKPESFVQALVVPRLALTHGGSLEPAAAVELKSIGLNEGQCPELSAALCDFLQAELGIPPERIYIEFSDLPRTWFGWNGKTFG